MDGEEEKKRTRKKRRKMVRSRNMRNRSRQEYPDDAEKDARG